jgi:hypothetical protein
MITKLLSLFFFCASLSAQEIPASFRDFSGGINDNTASIALKQNESPDALNVVIDDPIGIVKTRNGLLTCGSIPSGNTITSTYEYIRSNGIHELILTDNITVYTTQDCVIVSTIVTGLNSAALPYFDTFRDKLWVVNNSTHVITWDGTTATYLDGTGTKPNPSKGQYITHWKEREWIARLNSYPSGVAFSALTDSVGANIDPSVSSQSWPAANAFYIAQDDGSPIYGMKVYKDNMFIFKATGIWRIIFESVYNTQVVQAVSNVGCKFQDSIVELDNFIYFVGNDGIYKFDGNDVVRISDNIHGKFALLKQPLRLDKYQLWDSVTDWNTGTFSNVSTVSYPVGSIALSLTTTYTLLDNFSDNDYTLNPKWIIGGENLFSTPGLLRYQRTSIGTSSGYAYLSSSTAYGTWKFDVLVNSEYQHSDAIVYFVASTCAPSNTSGYGLKISGNTGKVSLYRSDAGALTLLNEFTPTGSIEYWLTYTVTRTFDGVFTVDCSLLSSSYGNMTHTDNTYSNGGYIILYAYVNQSLAGNDIVDFDNIYIPDNFKTSGTYTSQISTYSSLTQWKTFDVDETLNGQTIVYSVRAGTSAYNVGLNSYASISPGAIVSSIPANNHFQFKADFTTTDNSKTPVLNSAIANYQEGDASSDRLVAVNYNNRYYLSGSTTPANAYNDIVLVKSKTIDTWSIYDWKISAFTKWNNNLYGGLSNSANVARLDYGTNDNGAAINAYWTWGDAHFGNLAYKKSLSELYLYYLPTNGAHTAMQYSRDSGTTWNSITVPMNTAGAFGTKRLLFNGGNANAFRFKVLNNTLDEYFSFLGFDAFGKMYTFRE